MAEPAQDELLRLHRELDLISRNPLAGNFVSGWQTSHPYVEQYLPSAQPKPVLPIDAYRFLSDSAPLVKAIEDFHRSRDHVDYPSESIYISTGSSPLLLAFFLRLKEKGVSECWYVPPIYYSCYYFARSLGIRMRQLDLRPLHRSDFELELPQSQAVLIVADPIWVFGTQIHPTHLDQIVTWQRRTGSEVLVDGTFQYARWDPWVRGEQTAHLDIDLTFRIVCPTKSTAIHGVRFAYMLLPPRERESIRHPGATITGASGVTNEGDALCLMEALNSPRANRDLIEYIRQIHLALREKSILLEDAAEPSASYYTFGYLDEKIAKGAILMDQRFFELTGYDGFNRVNLLHPSWAKDVAQGTLRVI